MDGLIWMTKHLRRSRRCPSSPMRSRRRATTSSIAPSGDRCRRSTMRYTSRPPAAPGRYAHASGRGTSAMAGWSTMVDCGIRGGSSWRNRVSSRHSAERSATHVRQAECSPCTSPLPDVAPATRHHARGKKKKDRGMPCLPVSPGRAATATGSCRRVPCSPPGSTPTPGTSHRTPPSAAPSCTGAPARRPSRRAASRRARRRPP